MKLLCECGWSIHDNTDSQENKAHFVPDESWEAMHEDINAGSSSWDTARKVMRRMYQCHECSRLYVEDCSGAFLAFKPDDEVEFGTLKRT